MPEDNVVGTVTVEETQNIAASNTNEDTLATVTPTATGDVITIDGESTQTTNNALGTSADAANVTILNTSTIGDYSDANKGLAASSIGTPQHVIPNPLHSYASYTYGLSLHLMTPGDFNTLVSNQIPSYTPTNVLIASAGKYNNANFVRNPVFSDDFYFEDFKMTSVIGVSPMTGGTNNFDISFTIIEPNGFSFINRLLEVTTRIDAKNYLDVPYMLQVDFYGAIDSGSTFAPIPNQSKYIPIRLLGMKTKITAKGTEYRVTAAPYGHFAFQESVASTPTNFQVQAATVQDFFGSGAASQSIYNSATTNNQRVEQLQRELAGATTDAQRQDIQTQLNQINDLNQVYTVKEGYTNAVNGWYTYLQYKVKRLTKDTVTIIIDPEIATARVTIPEKNDIRKVANASKAEQNAARSAALNATVGGPKFTEGYYPVYAGQPIDKVIETVVRTSTYITNQVTDPTTDNPETMAQKLGRPLKWFKIVPKITIGDYDHSTGQYAKNYVYYVKKWTVSNKVPVAPMGKASGFVKKYDYLYTGHNSDVIDVSLDFDTLFYTQMTANKTENQEVMGMKRPNYNVLDRNLPEIYPTNTVMPKRIVYRSQDVQYGAQMNAYKDPKTLATGDLVRGITNSARGDMLNVKLTILGDPTFIKQDDVFYGQNSLNFNQLLTPNGSIVTDDGELYVLLIFKSPTDYDEVTGIMRNDRYNTNMWSGVYRILTIESNMARGKFTQTLNLARLFNQPQFDDLLGGQYSQVYQYQRIEERILNAALTPLQGIVRSAAGRLLGSLSSVIAVASAAMQIAANAERIATGIMTAVVTNAVNKATSYAQAWFNSNVLTPFENWAKENILTPLETWWNDISAQVGQWFDDTLFKAEMFFSGNWDAYTSEYLTCTADSFATDIATIASNVPGGVLDFSSMSAEGISDLIQEMGLETFDVVDPDVFAALDW